MNDHHKLGHDGNAQPANETPSAKDRVCGMNVRLNAGKPGHEHAGETYHFCSQGCHDKFAADPVHYLSGAHKQLNDDLPSGA